MKKFFSTRFSNGAVHFSLLILRVGLGAMMLTHGWPKLQHFEEMSVQFSDPLHVGTTVSLALTIFVEVVCAALLILGLFTRLLCIPLIVHVLVIIFMVHAGGPFGRQELAAHFLVGYLVILFCGPGRISLDGLIGK